MKKDTIHVLLLVEDNEDHAALVRRAFESHNSHVKLTHVETLREAHAFLETSTPDVAIVDHCLPDGKGLELLNGSMDERLYPVVLMTGHGDEKLAVEVIKAGASDYIVKSEESIQKLPYICERVSREWSLYLTNKASEKRDRIFRTVFENSTEAIMVTDAAHHILSVNASFRKITGYEEEDVLGKKPKIFRSGRHGQAFYDEMWKDIHGTGHWEGEIWNKKKNGQNYPEWLSITAVKDEREKITHYIGLFSDITKRKADEAKLRFQAHYDSLTALPNRTLIRERLSQAIKHAHRNERKVALLFLDLDHFKQINDTLGHLAGDRMLRKIAETLLASVREMDTVARAGGDEFLILLPDIVERKEASLVAEKIIHMLSQPIELDGHEAFLGGSIGITIAPDDGSEEIELMNNADMALYKAKGKGRSTYHFFSEKMEQEARTRTLLEWDLKRALEKKELRVYYQPIINFHSLKTISLEALVRWEHPRQGLLFPDRFIPISEESNLISQIGDWVLQTSCKQLQQWQTRYGVDFSIAVNISTRHFKYGDIWKSVTRALEKSRLPPEYLTIEITENLMLDPVEAMIEKLKTLKSLGIRLSVDDFGTGYSSLSYLARFPVDLLKIDKSFIENLSGNPEKKPLVEAIVKMGQSMKLKVIAEGIEKHEDLQYLKSLDCDMGQGYYFSKPISAEAYEKVLAGTAKE